MLNKSETYKFRDLYQTTKLECLRAYFWLFAQASLLIGLRGPEGMLGIKSWSGACNVVFSPASSYILLCQFSVPLLKLTFLFDFPYLSPNFSLHLSLFIAFRTEKKILPFNKTCGIPNG